ncbi:glycosyltransferase family 4 protein [Clostridium nigeriense]|uniref:glycosyltransferase family 4 protein n=1 Tax=Clostridium nigeriense TaxID=1805470 RepID=UPI00082A1825|nr:glycosyltransferase family 4 protein [Clostridium nigeriense]
MNILYISNSVHLGGDTKCILKLCKELKDKNKIILASSGGKLLPNFINMGIKHYIIKDVSLLNIFAMIFNIFKIIKIIMEENIQLIHSHHRMTTVLSKVATLFTRIKIIHTQHVCIENKYLLTRLFLRGISIICVSNSAKDILIKKCKLNKKNITTIYNTVEIKNENKNIDSILIDAKNKNYFSIAQISRIIDYKGVYDFVDIAKEVIATNKNTRFFFIGDGEESKNLREYISKNNLDDYVFMIGSKDNVIEHLKHIDLVLLCSYVEGLPLAPIEAFSQRIPVVATNIPGTCEEIINGINGYLAPVKDISSFAKRINEIYYNIDLYKSLKKGAYRTFTQNFSSEKYINSHLKFYKKVLKER